jgi:uncharacterized protein
MQTFPAPAELGRLDLSRIAQDLQIRKIQVESVVQLLDEGNTIPFITRYRKERTGGLDEEVLRIIQERVGLLRQLADRKQTILRSIENQGKLTDELRAAIHAADNPKRLEDLYLPFKPKKRTLATAARDKGLEPLALAVWNSDPAVADLAAVLPSMLHPEKELNTPEDVLAGVQHILAEVVAESADVRGVLRAVLWDTGVLTTSKSEKLAEGQGSDYKDYFAFKEPIRHIPPHRVLAINRGEKENALAVKLEWDAETGRRVALERLPLPLPGDPPLAPYTPPPPRPAATPPPAESGPAAEPPPPAEGTPAPAAEAPPAAEAAPPPPPTAADPAPPAPAEPPPAPAAEAPPAPPEPAPPVAPSAVHAEGRPAPHRRHPAELIALRTEALQKHPHAEFLKQVTDDALTRLLVPSLEREIRRELTQRSEGHAVSVFARNLRGKLLAAPLRGRRVLAVDPGFRTGCKLAVLDETGNLLEDGVVYPHTPPAAKRAEAKARLEELVRKHQVHVIAIGNGTACRETEEVVSELIADLDAWRKGIASPAPAAAAAPAEPPAAANPAAVTVEATPAAPTAPAAEPPALPSPAPEAAAPPPPEAAPVAAPSAEAPAPPEASAVAPPSEAAAPAPEAAAPPPPEAPPVPPPPPGPPLPDALPELAYVIVNEAGASVYSASPVGREEFPGYDATLRGTISIGRRLQDPLSELVKIDPQHVGVGLYQHDVSPKQLRESLDAVVESCVNAVGVDLNTASVPLLRHVSGLNQLVARDLVEFRKSHGPFRSRDQLKQVPGIGEARFVQAAGFLKIGGGDQPLDGTWIHPESYGVARQLLGELGYSEADLNNKPKVEELREKLKGVSPEEVANRLQVGAPTVHDILDALARPGRDPREDLPPPIFKKGVLKLEDLQPGMELKGTVLNVVDFGAFIDVGLKDSGLVHISQMANRYVKSPYDVTAVGDVVTVWVLSVDKERRRVSLTMIPPGTERKPPERRGPPPRREGAPRPPQQQGDRPPPRREGAPAQQGTGRPPAARRPPAAAGRGARSGAGRGPVVAAARHPPAAGRPAAGPPRAGPASRRRASGRRRGPAGRRGRDAATAAGAAAQAAPPAAQAEPVPVRLGRRHAAGHLRRTRRLLGGEKEGRAAVRTAGPSFRRPAGGRRTAAAARVTWGRDQSRLAARSARSSNARFTRPRNRTRPSISTTGTDAPCNAASAGSASTSTVRNSKSRRFRAALSMSQASSHK